jgi:hypothetical protein
MLSKKLGIAYYFNLKEFTKTLKLSKFGSLERIVSMSRTNDDIEDKSYLLVCILKLIKRSLGILPDLTKN